MSARDELIRRAKERADAPVVPEEWGYVVALDIDESFVGRWRGEAVDAQNDRRVFLLWDENGQPCFSRTYAALEREIDRVKPALGATIVIYRGDDYASAKGPGYSFGVEVAPNDEPLPGGVVVADGSDIPF